MNTQRTAPNLDHSASLDSQEGFVSQPVTADLARRQLQVSLGVIGLIVGASLAIFATTGFAPPRADSAFTAELTVQQPHFVRPMTAANARSDAARQPDG